MKNTCPIQSHEAISYRYSKYVRLTKSAAVTRTSRLSSKFLKKI